jgi:hypothetical protein
MFYKIVLEPELETQTQQSTANKQLRESEYVSPRPPGY